MKKFTTYITSMALLIGFLMSPGSISADSNQIEVEFEHEPLFSESNFFPGSQVTRYIKITNQSNNPVMLRAGGDHTGGCFDGADCLTEVLDLEIKGARVTHQSTLKEFLNSPAELDQLEAGQSMTLHYAMTMKSEAGNQFQSQETEFSLVIAWQDETNGQTGTTIDTGGSGSTGRSGGFFFSSQPESELTISEPELLTTDSIRGTAELSWSTSQPAYSWIIYGPAKDGPYSLIENQPDHFGYPDATTPGSTKTTDHTAQLSGLEPGAVYYYRLVAQASPHTITRKYELHIPTTATAETETLATITLAEVTQPPSERPLTDAPTNVDPVSEPDDQPTDKEDEPAEETRSPITLEPDDQSLTASLLGAVGNRINAWLIIPIFLILLFTLFFLYRRRQSDYAG